jgi:lipopolysaccharide/colanic/teichoic acid biosynthesis glycosyltransferase
MEVKRVLIETDSRQPEAGSRSLDSDIRPSTLRGQINAAIAATRLPAYSPPQSWYRAFKAVAETLAALVLLVVTAPLILLAALLVKLTSPGPAFYTQTRVGRRGRLFTIYKLRTMIHNCESLTGPRWSIPGDPRVTWLGRLLRLSHLDELPQLVNVLRGQMSLIGPRPERPEFVPELAREIPTYRDRLAVRPGVTGLAQVNLPADTELANVRRKLGYDLYYIRNLGFWLDFRILVCTVLYSVGVPFRLSRKLLRLPAAEPVERPAPPPAEAPSLARPKKAAA